MNIYDRLLRLYRTNMLKTPLEDFTTEILAGILGSYPEIGDAFVNEVLQIEGNRFSFSTQEHFTSADPEHPDCRVDMVIRGENVICFLESKVEAREGYIQLDRYSRVLDELASTSSTYLKYCTKYFDAKDISSHRFQQFRWATVYRYLKKHASSDIIQHFLYFLDKHNMSDNMEFNLNDLVTMQGMNQTMKKMDSYLEKIKPVFARYFGAGRTKDSNNIRQIKNFSRYIFHAEQIFGSGYSEIGAGFDFEEQPVLKVWIWVSAKNPKASTFKQALRSTNLDNNGEDWMGCTNSLSDYISSESMEQQIEEWFASSFEKIKRFREEHPELDWHI